jgi:hypothetical protein
MKDTVGTFNLNNLFSRFNFAGAIDEIQTGGPTVLTVAGGKEAFPYFGADMRPEHNHIHSQPLPPKAGSYPSFSPTVEPRAPDCFCGAMPDLVMQDQPLTGEGARV